MVKRLLLGPIMILFLVGGVIGDQWIAKQPLPAGLQSLSRSVFGESSSGNWPRGVLVFAIVLLLGVLAARELAGILADKGILASKRISTFAAVLGLIVSCGVPAGVGAVDAVAVVSLSAMMVLAVSIVFFARHRTVEGVVAATGGALLAYVYLGLMFGFLLAIRRDHSVEALLWVIMVTKACDIGAYFTGKAIGRTKLIPWLSPGKTWEGLFGGMAFSVAAGVLGWRLVGGSLAHPPAIWAFGAAGALLGLIGQAGDLVESVLKRDAGIKDSGHAIPGFGGILDVIDSPLLVGPFAYWWLRWIDHFG
jgi:phosphatidate cytidylyltransferase